MKEDIPEKSDYSKGIPKSSQFPEVFRKKNNTCSIF